jgi:FSR family fosmidomycin resistance protein-like MFS transporter
MALFALMTMTPLFAQRGLGLSPAQTGVAFASAMLLGSVGQPLIGRLSDRTGRVGIFAVGSVTAAALTAGALVIDSPLGTITLLTGAMGVLVAIRSSVLAMAVDYVRGREATALGFIFVMLDGVGALGAVLAGFVGDFSLHYSFVLASGLSLASVGIITVALRKNSGDLHG